MKRFRVESREYGGNANARAFLAFRSFIIRRGTFVRAYYAYYALVVFVNATVSPSIIRPA